MMQSPNNPSPEEASETLESITRLESAGLARGLDSRRFSFAISLWAGVLVFAIAVESGLFWILLIGGVFAIQSWRRRQKASVREVRGGRDLSYAILLAIPAGGLFIASNVARQDFGLVWAPAAGAAIMTIGLFLLMEIVYGPARRRAQKELGS